MQRSTAFALLGGAVVLAGCQARLDPSEGAQITCEGRSQCPLDWTCNEAIGLCVRTDRQDVVALALKVAATVEPSALRAGAIALVTLDLHELQCRGGSEANTSSALTSSPRSHSAIASSRSWVLASSSVQPSSSM